MAVTILGSGSTPVTGTREISTQATLGTSYTFSNGLTESLESVVLGGALTANTNVHGSDTYNMSFGANSAGSQVADFNVWADGDVYIASNGTGSGTDATGKLELSDEYVLLQTGTASNKAIEIDASAFTIIDNDNTKGMVYDDDYTANFTTRSIVDRDFVEAVSENVMHVVKVEVPYTDEGSETSLITLPANAVVWDFGVAVVNNFNDSGTDYLDLGLTGSTNVFQNNLDVSGAGWSTLSLTAIPYTAAIEFEVVAQYDGGNHDASQGQAYVYVHYTLH